MIYGAVPILVSSMASLAARIRLATIRTVVLIGSLLVTQFGASAFLHFDYRAFVGVDYFVVLFWVVVGLEQVFPRNRYTFGSAESLKSAACFPIRLLMVGLVSSAVVMIWDRHPGLTLRMVGTSWPIWLQVVIFTLVADFLIYCIHRAQHAYGIYWKFHKVHHATRELTAIANFRTNVIELAVVQVGSRLVLLHVMGLSAAAVAVSSLVTYTVAGTVSHSNLDIGRGRWRWLNYVVVTPVFHAMHHALGNERRNYGETFTLWDVLFGTFEMPSEPVTEFGINDAGFVARNVLTQQFGVFLPDQ